MARRRNRGPRSNKLLEQRIADLARKKGSRRKARTVASGGRIFSARVTPANAAKEFIVSVSSKKGNFYDALAQWPALIENRLVALLDNVTALAFENIVARTPVGPPKNKNSGPAAQGWFQTSPGPYVRFIGNNEPHIRRLEHGWSRQPNRNFMVRATLKRLPQFVDQAAVAMSAG